MSAGALHGQFLEETEVRRMMDAHRCQPSPVMSTNDYERTRAVRLARAGQL